MESKVCLGSAVSPLFANDRAQGRSGAGQSEENRARKVAREFEAMFIGMMLKSMRETTATDGLTDGGKGEEIYRSLLDQEYANAMAARGGIGLAAVIEQELLRHPSGEIRHEPRNDRSEGLTTTDGEVAYED